MYQEKTIFSQKLSLFKTLYIPRIIAVMKGNTAENITRQIMK